MLRKKPNFC